MLERDARRCRHLLQVRNRAAGSRQTPRRPIRTDSGTVASCLMNEWPEPMHERADQLPRRLLAVDSELKLAFERRLVESSTLAFRVAYSVLRHREDAEDVAQEAFAKAYRNFRQLRDRDRFRAWLARMTWRLAIDRCRAVHRRQKVELAATDAGGTTPADVVETRERE